MTTATETRAMTTYTLTCRLTGPSCTDLGARQPRGTRPRGAEPSGDLKMSNAIDCLKSRARQEQTVTLVEAVTAIGPLTSKTTNEVKMTRAAMLDVIEEREGEQFVSDLVDAVGMEVTKQQAERWRDAHGIGSSSIPGDDIESITIYAEGQARARRCSVDSILDEMRSV